MDRETGQIAALEYIQSKQDRYADLEFFRGVGWGLLISIPLWVIIIWIGMKVLKGVFGL